MNKGHFIQELRRRANNSLLFLTRNKYQARKFNIHPMCWQVWCKAINGAPYVVLPICSDAGGRRDPADMDIEAVLAMSADRTHQGRGNWAIEMASAAVKSEDHKMRRKQEESVDWLRHEGRERLAHVTGNHLVIPQAGWTPDGKSLRG